MYVEGQEPAYCPAEHYHQIITILGKRIKSASKAIKLDDRCQICTLVSQPKNLYPLQF